MVAAISGSHSRDEETQVPLGVTGPLGLHQDVRSCRGSIGSVRMRLPVAAKIAFVTAGATAAVGASPRPPGGFGAFHQMRLDHRRFVDPHRPIVV